MRYTEKPPVEPPAGLPAAALTFVLVLFQAAAAPAQDLSRIPSGPPVDAAGSSRAVNWVDTDGDGDLDLYVTNGGSVGENNEFYRNDGGGQFASMPGSAIAIDGLRADGSSWGDYDNDGDADLFVVSWWGELNALFENMGGGDFAPVTAGAPVTTGSFSEGCAWVDYDADGDLDLYVSNSGTGEYQDNLLYRNEGAGAFAEITGEPIVDDGRTSRGPAWGDYDNDGDADLFVANESGEDNALYRNELVETGEATFHALDAGAITGDGGNSWSGSWGDYDNDGDLDMVVANQNGEANFLYRNELVETGAVAFSRILDQDPATDTGWLAGTHWADWDNDGDLDLMMTSGYALVPTRLRKCFYYRNDSGRLHRDVSSDASQDRAWSYGAAWGDHDGDGDLDLCTANWNGAGEANYLYRNEADGNGNHWLTVGCEGTASNRSGIGARIRVVADAGGGTISQIREISGADGYCSQNLRAHFGLGVAAAADSLVVRWPSGTIQILTGVAGDQFLSLVEPAAVGVGQGEGIRAPRSGALEPARPNPFRTETAIRFTLPGVAPVRLRVFDTAGRKVRDLQSGAGRPGVNVVTWDGRDDVGRAVASGVYFYRLDVEGRFADRRKVVLAR